MKAQYKILLLSVLFFLLLGVAGCRNGNKPGTGSSGNNSEELSKLTLFVAAGLTEPMNELIDSFGLTHNVQIQTNYASSGTLARQIEQQEIPDIYISASKKWMKYIDSLKYVVNGKTDEVVRDKLVLIAPIESNIDSIKIDSSTPMESIIGNGMLSIGDPAHVPAGEYARQSLVYFGWWPALEGRLLPAKDVRSAVMVVELGEVPAGIAYYTVARKSEKVRIIGTFPDQSHKPIVFTSGICKQSKLAHDFNAYIISSGATPIWEKYGFTR